MPKPRKPVSFAAYFMGPGFAPEGHTNAALAAHAGPGASTMSRIPHTSRPPWSTVACECLAVLASILLLMLT